jgi:hypothetical protein
LFFSGSVFSALFLGTYVKLRLVRTARGKVLLTKTRRFCFVPAVWRQINVRRFDRLVIESGLTGGGISWPRVVLVFGLLGAFGGFIVLRLRGGDGVEPYGIYRVFLKRQGTDETFTLFWRSDSPQLRDIVDTLSEAAGLEITRR